MNAAPQPVVHRLVLSHLGAAGESGWPVHGFVVTTGDTAILVDTGVGGKQQWLDDWRAVNRTVAEALADVGLTPGDISLVINTHLHFDHCGQNSVFRGVPVYVQRAEAEHTRRTARELWDWFGFMDADFELLDGDAPIAPGVRVIATPGHTPGHQCVLVESAPGEVSDLLIGDAVYTAAYYADPERTDLARGQAADLPAWRDSVRRIHAQRAANVRFCHDDTVLGPGAGPAPRRGPN